MDWATKRTNWDITCLIYCSTKCEMILIANETVVTIVAFYVKIAAIWCLAMLIHLHRINRFRKVRMIDNLDITEEPYRSGQIQYWSSHIACTHMGLSRHDIWVSLCTAPNGVIEAIFTVSYNIDAVTLTGRLWIHLAYFLDVSDVCYLIELLLRFSYCRWTVKSHR